MGSRRVGQRVPLEGFASEIVLERERYGVVVDLCPNGLRLQRPFDGPRDRYVQLEFEIPGTDEMIWAKGEICFDQLWRRRGLTQDRLIRTSGIRIVAAAPKHLRLLRDYSVDRRERGDGLTERRSGPLPMREDWLMSASCYRH
jgi:hypothetical protein